jgi:hypothetical protein
MLVYREHHGDIDDLVRHHRISNLVNMLLVNTVIIFIIGALTYGEKFRFWDYAYSFLGMIRTPGGNQNTLSFIIYAIGCLMNSFISFRISNNLTVRTFRILFKICGIGYLLLMLPCDIINSLHSIGGAIAFGSLWFFSMISIIDIYLIGKRFYASLSFILLNGTVLPYAFMFFIQSPYKEIAQKPALLGLIIVMKLIISEMKREDIFDQEQNN